MMWKILNIYLFNSIFKLIVHILLPQDVLNTETKSTSFEANPLTQLIEASLFNSSSDPSQEHNSSSYVLHNQGYSYKSEIVEKNSKNKYISTDTLNGSENSDSFKTSILSIGENRKLVKKQLVKRNVQPELEPPPMLMPPPPFPPDDMFKTRTDVVETPQDQGTIFNSHFQPRARNIPAAMREAMLNPNNIIVKSATAKKTKKATKKSEQQGFSPPNIPPPPPPRSSDGLNSNIRKPLMDQDTGSAPLIHAPEPVNEFPHPSNAGSTFPDESMFLDPPPPHTSFLDLPPPPMIGNQPSSEKDSFHDPPPPFDAGTSFVDGGMLLEPPPPHLSLLDLPPPPIPGRAQPSEKISVNEPQPQSGADFSFVGDTLPFEPPPPQTLDLLPPPLTGGQISPERVSFIEPPLQSDAGTSFIDDNMSPVEFVDEIIPVEPPPLINDLPQTPISGRQPPYEKVSFNEIIPQSSDRSSIVEDGMPIDKHTPKTHESTLVSNDRSRLTDESMLHDPPTQPESKTSLADLHPPLVKEAPVSFLSIQEKFLQSNESFTNVEEYTISTPVFDTTVPHFNDTKPVTTTRESFKQAVDKALMSNVEISGVLPEVAEASQLLLDKELPSSTEPTSTSSYENVTAILEKGTDTLKENDTTGVRSPDTVEQSTLSFDRTLVSYTETLSPSTDPTLSNILDIPSTLHISATPVKEYIASIQEIENTISKVDNDLMSEYLPLKPSKSVLSFQMSNMDSDLLLRTPIQDILLSTTNLSVGKHGNEMPSSISDSLVVSLTTKPIFSQLIENTILEFKEQTISSSSAMYYELASSVPAFTPVEVELSTTQPIDHIFENKMSAVMFADESLLNTNIVPTPYINLPSELIHDQGLVAEITSSQAESNFLDISELNFIEPSDTLHVMATVIQAMSLPSEPKVSSVTLQSSTVQSNIRPEMSDKNLKVEEIMSTVSMSSSDIGDRATTEHTDIATTEGTTEEHVLLVSASSTDTSETTTEQTEIYVTETTTQQLSFVEDQKVQEETTKSPQIQFTQTTTYKPIFDKTVNEEQVDEDQHSYTTESTDATKMSTQEPSIPTKPHPPVKTTQRAPMVPFDIPPLQPDYNVLRKETPKQSPVVPNRNIQMELPPPRKQSPKVPNRNIQMELPPPKQSPVVPNRNIQMELPPPRKQSPVLPNRNIQMELPPPPKQSRVVPNRNIQMELPPPPKQSPVVPNRNIQMELPPPPPPSFNQKQTRVQKGRELPKSPQHIPNKDLVNKREKYLSFFDPESKYFNIKPWSIKAPVNNIEKETTQRRTLSDPKFKKQTQKQQSVDRKNDELVRRMIENTGKARKMSQIRNEDKETTKSNLSGQSRDKRPILKQSTVVKPRGNDGFNIRRMIETIETVKTKPRFGPNLQLFVAPGLKSNQNKQTGRADTALSNRITNTNTLPEMLASTGFNPFLKSNVWQPGVRPNQRQTRNLASRSSKPATFLPQPSMARHVKNTIRRERIAFKRPVPSVTQLPELSVFNKNAYNYKMNKLNSLSKKYKTAYSKNRKKNNLFLTQKNEFLDTPPFKFLGKKSQNKSRNKQRMQHSIQSKKHMPEVQVKRQKQRKRKKPPPMSYIPQIQSKNNIPVVSVQNQKDRNWNDLPPSPNIYSIQSKKEVPVVPGKKQKHRNWNEPPPPITMETNENTPTFEVSFIPPPPPPPPKQKPRATTRVHPVYISTIPPSLIPKPRNSSTGTTSTKTDNESIDPSYKKELSNPEEVCGNCTYVSNFCYMREPSNCNRFIICYKQGNRIRATEKECSYGLFWSESKIACIQSTRAECPIDPCQKRGVRSHPYIGKCRAYWTCRRRRSDARCCPNGYAYGGGSRSCVPDKNCTTGCYSKDPITNSECHLRGVPDSPSQYVDGGLLRTCAPGTRFEQSVCTCIRSNVGGVDKGETKEKDDNYQCGPDIKLDFSGKSRDAFKDKSGNSQSIGVFDVVQTMREQAMFNGRGSLKLWRFSNVELGPELAVKFRFYAHGQSHRSETLLSNCIGQKDAAAIDIRLQTDVLEIVFSVKTTKSPETHMRMFYKPNKWNEVILRYDGMSMSAAIGPTSKTIFVEGVIPTKHAAISIGGCSEDDGFIGYMDDVILYNECIPDEVRDLVFE